MTHFRLDLDADGVLLVTFDTPGATMNTFSMEAVDELESICERIATDAAVKGAVITSGKPSFCAGADLKSLFPGIRSAVESLQGEERKRRVMELGGRLGVVFRKIETCGKPVAAAVNGLALGGGLELPLACHYRIIAEDTGAKVGLPEVRIGLFPAAGGSQRLPRLIGAQEAMLLMSQGKQIDAASAVQKGVFHDAAPAAEIVDRAKAWVRANPTAKAPWDEDGFRLPGGGPYHPKGIQVFGAASPMMRRETLGNYPAVRCLLSAIYEGLQVPIDAGLRIEARYFANLLLRPEATAMIRSIFVSKGELDKGGRRPAGQEAQPIRKIGIIGAGFMGAGVANVSAGAGIEVVLVDMNQEGADRGKAHVEKDLSKRVAKGRMAQAKADEVLGRITATTDYAALSDVDLVVEAVFEDPGVKAKVYEQLDAVLPAGAVLGSNTSTIPITQLAQSTKDPERFVGIHFFSPVEKMLLVELITGERTSDAALSRAIDFVAAIKKTPIVVRDTWGFYANRCVMRYLEQGAAMLTEGYKPALIENGARMGGMPVGPLSLFDEVAIDLGVKIIESKKAVAGAEYTPGPTDPLVVRMSTELGRHGRKNKKGFYDYPEGAAKRLWPELGQFAANGLQEPQPEWTEVRDRVLYTQALEAARCMEEGIVSDPREADVGSILGWGFAPFTGGVLSFIDTIGTSAFVARADALARAYGEPFTVPKLLREMAVKDETFYQRFGTGQLQAAE